MSIYKSSEKLEALQHPEKIYLQNPNLCYVIARGHENRGTLRETFLLNILRRFHCVTLPSVGDFLIDKTVTLELGGVKIRDLENSFVVQDNVETGIGRKIPLWLFGFLY